MLNPMNRLFCFGIPPLKTLAWIVLMCVCLTGCGDPPSPQEELKNDIASCWPCSLYKAAFDALAKMMLNVYETTTYLGLILMGVGLLFYLAFASGKLVMSLKEPNVKEEIIKIIHVLFKALLVGAVLSLPQYVLEFCDMVLSPVILWMLELSRQILEAGSSIGGSTALIAPESIPTANDNLDFALFNGQVSYRVQDLIYRIFTALKGGMGLGLTIMQQWQINTFFIGLFVIFAFFALILIFPFAFIDAFLRIGVVVIISPFLLASWVFPATKDWIKKGWNIVFSALFNILFSCIFIGLLVSCITTYSNQYMPGFFNVTAQKSDPTLAQSAASLETGFFSMMLVLLSMMILAKHIPQVARFFGGDGSGNPLVGFLGQLRQLAVSVTTIAAGAALAVVTGGAGATLGKKMMKKGAKDLAAQGKEMIASAAHEASSTGQVADDSGKKDDEKNQMNYGGE